MVGQILIGFVCSFFIAVLAYWKRSLSGSGAVAAVMIGTVLYASSSLPWFGMMIAFFVSSSVLSKWKQNRKKTVELTYEKTGRRDAMQVLANGGLAALFGLLYSILAQPFLWFAFLGVMATVNADTWATEIGSVSKLEPIFIFTGKRVPRGTSGAVSQLGLAAAAAGAFFIGSIAVVLVYLQQGYAHTEFDLYARNHFMKSLLIATIAGTFGALFDSVLGASVQRMYKCIVCEKYIEKDQHCGKQARVIRGWPLFTNDMVNAVSSLAGGVVAIAIGYLL